MKHSAIQGFRIPDSVSLHPGYISSMPSVIFPIMIYFQAAQKDLSGEAWQISWSVGVMEYRSGGSRTHHSTTPPLQYSGPYEAIERTLRQCSGQSAYEFFLAAC
jgi:hypothetical protein